METRFGAKLHKAEKDDCYVLDYTNHKVWGKPWYSSRTGNWLLILANAIIWFSLFVIAQHWELF